MLRTQNFSFSACQSGQSSGRVRNFSVSADRAPELSVFAGNRAAIAVRTGRRPSFSGHTWRKAASEGDNSGHFSLQFHNPSDENPVRKPTFRVFVQQKRPAPALAAPTALRFRGNCPALLRGICKGVSCVARAPSCPQRGVHPRSWGLARHAELLPGCRAKGFGRGAYYGQQTLV